MKISTGRWLRELGCSQRGFFSVKYGGVKFLSKEIIKINKTPMKKFLFILIALAIFVPAAAYAFSFHDVVNFGKSLIRQEPQPTPEEVDNGFIDQEAGLFSYSAQTKYAKWKDAYDKKDINLVLGDSRNLYFTDSEISYLIAQELSAIENPPARDVNISFSDNLIKISGISMLKNFYGKFYLEAKIVNNEGRINLSVSRARYKNFYFPSLLAQIVLRNKLQAAIDFLYSDIDHQNLSVAIGNGFIQLNYGQ
jgi:hypothetical protein